LEFDAEGREIISDADLKSLQTVESSVRVTRGHECTLESMCYYVGKAHGSSVSASMRFLRPAAVSPPASHGSLSLLVCFLQFIVHSCVRVAYTHQGSEESSGFGLLDSQSLGLAEHQPRLSALFHRLDHLRTHSLTCSSCGPIERSYWFCSHCHLSLCPPCWASWHYPEAAANTISAASRLLCASSSCQSFHPPLHRPPFSATIIAGGLNDLSHLHIPVVVVSILGMPATSSFPLAQTLEYTNRDHANTAGYGCYNFRIPTNTSGSTVEKLKERVASICSLVRDCYAGRFVLDLRAHAIRGHYEFVPHLFTTAELFEHFIKPVARAFRAAQRLTRGRYPAFDSSNAAVAASRILVVFHCCDTEFTTFLQMLDEFLQQENIALELLLFQKPLLLKEMNNLLPSFMAHYTNALCPLSTFDLLEQTTSPAQRRDYLPTLLSPRPRSRQYHVRVLGEVARAPLSLDNRLPAGGLPALSRRSDPFGVYAPPAVELLASSAASRSVPLVLVAPPLSCSLRPCSLSLPCLLVWLYPVLRPPLPPPRSSALSLLLWMALLVPQGQSPACSKLLPWPRLAPP
jgi:hypothetical protein